MLAADVRLLALIDAAERRGILRVIPDEEADRWREEWRRRLDSLSAGVAISPKRVPIRHSGEIAPAVLKAGGWVELDVHGNRCTAQVLGLVSPGQLVEEVVGPDRLALLDRRCHPDWDRPLSRVAVLIPAAMMSRPVIKLLYLGTFLAHARAMEAPPALVPFRTSSPLAPGAIVSWGWHSRYGVCRYTGAVLAFVPAFHSISGMGYDVRGTIHDSSRQDRYLVQTTAPSRVIAPPAYVLEEAFLGSGCGSV